MASLIVSKSGSILSRNTTFWIKSSYVLCCHFGSSKKFDMGNYSSLRREEVEWPVVEKTISLILKTLNPTAQQASKVINFTDPEQMKEILDLGSGDEFTSKTSVEDFLVTCQKLIDNSVKTGNSMFLNQLYRGCDAYGLAASLLSEFLNTNAHTFEVAPAFTMIETDVVSKLAKLCGYTDNIEGIFTPGGSIACMYAINLARFKYDSSIKKMGVYNQPRMIIFASAQCHYAVTKGACFMGLGSDSVVSVACDDKGAMSIQDLKLKVKAVSSNGSNTVPLMVWATSGTTVLSGFDNLALIANVCEKNQMWLHVDACVGGAFLFSKVHKNLLNGIGRSDSLTWNWHKLLGAPLQTSVFLTKHKDLLREAHSATASYLFHNVKHYDTSYDSGNSSIQCGRKTDAIKVWLMWKARGSEELEKIVDHAHYMAHKLFKKMQQNPRFRMVLPHAQGSTVCFWVIPPSLRKDYTNVNENSADFWKKVAPVALELKKRMVREGSVMLQYQPLPDKKFVDFFRVTVTCAPEFTEEDVNKLIEHIVRLSDDM